MMSGIGYATTTRNQATLEEVRFVFVADQMPVVSGAASRQFGVAQTPLASDTSAAATLGLISRSGNTGHVNKVKFGGKIPNEFWRS